MDTVILDDGSHWKIDPYEGGRLIGFSVGDAIYITLPELDLGYPYTLDDAGQEVDARFTGF